MPSLRGILFPHRDATSIHQIAAPDCFPDLHLNDIVDAITPGHTKGDLLDNFFTCPLHDTGTIEYRQHVFRDLEHDETHAIFERFVGGLRSMRRQLDHATKLWHALSCNTRVVSVGHIRSPSWSSVGLG